MTCNHRAQVWQDPVRVTSVAKVTSVARVTWSLPSQGGKGCLDVLLPQPLPLMSQLHLAPVAGSVDNAWCVLP